MHWSSKHTRVVAVYAVIGLISAFHYSTGTHAHQLHDIYRRLYYLPIIVAAFLGGLRGGVIVSLVVCAAYLPHALGHIAMDPARNSEKFLEMLLYIAVGVVTGYLVSDLRRTHSRLRSSIEQLRTTEHQLIATAKLAAVGRLSAGLAHEIRNPLASIKGSAEILADDFPPGHRKHRILRVLIEESERLDNVLSRFLAFARPRRLDWEEFPVDPEVQATLELLRNHGEGRGVEVSFLGIRREGGSAPISAPLVRGDREQLRQVVLNVLLNACQAAGAQGHVRVESTVEGDGYQLSVWDSGPGFTTEALENAFTPFFTTKEQGSGLGLAVSHRIMELHGGRIRVSNPPSGGGLVQLDIPLRGNHAQSTPGR